MAINTITATAGNWLFNGEGFAQKVSGFGDLSKWQEVTDDFKTQWEAEHANPEVPEIGGGNFLTEVPDDGKVYGRTHGEWVEDEDGAVYELIEDITLEEAVQKIVRTTEPDGTPYNFKRMRVLIIKPSNVFGNAFRQVFGFNVQNADISPLCSIMANETNAHLAITTCKISNGYWDVTMHTQHQNGVGQKSYGMPYILEATGNTARILVYQLTCTESVLFEAGTNIKIYGIR